MAVSCTSQSALALIRSVCISTCTVTFYVIASLHRVYIDTPHSVDWYLSVSLVLTLWPSSFRVCCCKYVDTKYRMCSFYVIASQVFTYTVYIYLQKQSLSSSSTYTVSMIFLPFLCTYLQSTCLHHGLWFSLLQEMKPDLFPLSKKNIPIWLDYNKENKARLLRWTNLLHEEAASSLNLFGQKECSS